jgi:hypothetical protein
MMNRRSIPGWLTLLGALLLTPSTLGAPPEGPTPAPPAAQPKGSAGVAAQPAPADEADALFARAGAAFDAGRNEEALSLLLQAWERKRTFDIAGNLGIVELKLGRARDAAEHLAYALRNFPPTENEKVRAGLREKLEEARRHVAAVIVRVNVRDAEIRVNGKAIDLPSSTGGEIYVDAGAVTIEARRDGFAPASRMLTVEKGAIAQEVSLDLQRLESPGSDGGHRGTIAQDARPSLVPAIVLGGVAVVGVGIGVGLLVAAGGEASTVKELNRSIVAARGSCVSGATNFDAQCTELEAAARRGDTLHDAGVGVLIGAGVAAAAAGAYLLLWPARAEQPRSGSAVRVVPVMAAKDPGVVVIGTF